MSSHYNKRHLNASGDRRRATFATKDLSRPDRLILCELQRDGAISNSMLAEKASLSESAATRHRHRLEEEGYVKRYAAVVDVERLGYGETAFVEVQLASQQEDALMAFEAAVVEIDEVVACHAVAGELDYLLHIVARDAHDVERIRHQLAALPGIAHLHTHIVLNQVLQREVVAPA